MGPCPRTHVILATDIWLGLMVDLVPSLRSSASSCGGGRESAVTDGSAGTGAVPVSPCPPDLVERDELGVQPHQVSRLRHLAQHERDEGGVALALLARQRRLGQQHVGLDGVLDCGERGKRREPRAAPPTAPPLPPRHSLTRLYLALRFLRA